jgi:amino-acid N-acetyltransferase
MSTNDQVVIHPAKLTDIPELLGVINAYAAQGVMLPRTEFELAENIRDFVIARIDGGIVGCGALHFYTPRSAEVRSLAVSPRHKTAGIGRKIVETLEVEARENELQSMFAFTYVPGFFTKLGFSQVDRGELPLKAWKDCLRCPKFQACDEIPMLKQLTEQRFASRPSDFHILDSPTSAPSPSPIAGVGV